ncbi:molecular chaperone Hsp70 [Planktothricoides sp. SR001]|uniref:Hsp70 family protein n=1 Tax=Planktothricoides sp. SR001 TaxID=1705388 RepID=UPI0006BF79F7|nr:Hsp70 family protein [Planktothricoides sp. SR001]KOR36929.1 molecular chaperone Hsp70 [Planktothricoides sp. SR001]
MGNVIGIDLGTTNSVAALKLVNVEVVKNEENSGNENALTRSVIAFDKGKLVVGTKAYNQLRDQPENVIISIKRLMGRGFNDPTVQQQLSRFGYKITQSTQGTDNSLSVWLDGREYQPEDISAEILKKVVENAQLHQEEKANQKGKITHAVVTIPAYFNDKQRYATQTAVMRAGLGLLELLPEPTAAAISYGFKPDSDDSKTMLVYDFGGGTFDSSLITVSGNQFIESGKAGDLWLGGDDIDHKLFEFVKAKVAHEERIENIDALIAKMPYYHRVRFLADVKFTVEQAKIDLSTNETARIIPATPLLDELGMAIPIEVVITRRELEEMILPLVERTIAICQDTLKYSEYPVDQVDIVLLVGGSSKIPLVQRKVREAFGADKVVVHPDPMYAVAQGAAIVAAGLPDKVSTVSRDYFIELANEPRYKLIKQGDILPVNTAHTFRTEAEGQRLIHFKFSSPDRVSEDIDRLNRDERIGEMWLALDKPYPRGTEVAVTVELDEKNSSLQITAALKNNPAVRVSCSFSRGGVDEEIAREVERTIAELNQAANLTETGVQTAYEIAGAAISASNQIRGQNNKPQADRVAVAQAKLQELKTFASEDRDVAQFFVREFEFLMEHCSFMLPDAQKQRIESLTKQLKEAIAIHNLSAMQKLAEDAERELKNLPEEIQKLLIAKDAIQKAHSVDPTRAGFMADKLHRLIHAIEHEKINEANRLWNELIPDIREYGLREFSAANIATGITR